MSTLPINIEHLLGATTVESDRIEFKSGWNPDAIYRSICAFANDFDNIGGGYIVIGVEDDKGKAKRPVKGFEPKQVFEQLDLVGGPQEHLRPKNVALMLFNHHPEKFFPYTQIDIVVFPEGLSDRPDLFIENPPIKGPVQYQIREALSFIRNQILREKVIKLPDRAEASRVWNYPYDAIEA